jgi:superfamily II DNA/RNA helicase
MPEKIRALAKRILQDPIEVNIAISRPPDKIVQRAYVVYEQQKIPVIQHIVKTTPYKNALIFCSRKQTVKELTRQLKRTGLPVEEIHSDLEQAQRENVLGAFASGRVPLLVATDILSRGIDIDTIDLVINFDVPGDGEDYVHRIGRTARAEADGTAYTLISEMDQRNFGAIEQLIGKEVDKVPVPDFLGPAPVYDPKRKSSGGGHRGRGPGSGPGRGQRGGGAGRGPARGSRSGPGSGPHRRQHGGGSTPGANQAAS